MTTRRRLLAGTAGTAVAGLAGCLGVLTGSDPLEFAAEPVAVPDSTQESTGYDEQRVEPAVEERTFAAGGQERTVEVTNWVAEYARVVSLPFVPDIRAALFVALSTPQVEVLDRTFNPVGDMEPADLAETIQQRYDGVRNLQQADERTVPVLGTETPVGRFAGEAVLTRSGGDDRTIEVVVHISEAVESGGDFVVCVGVHPRLLDDTAQVDTLMRTAAHPVDPPTSSLGRAAGANRRSVERAGRHHPPKERYIRRR